MPTHVARLEITILTSGPVVRLISQRLLSTETVGS
jgi:hypothetical protein